MTDIIVPAEQTEGTRFKFKAWLKPAGSDVKADEPVAELETDKVTMEVVAPASGRLEQLSIEAGSDVEPGTRIGRISSGAAPEAPIAKAPLVPQQPRERGLSADSGASLGLSPAVRRLLAEHLLDPKDIRGTGRGGRITHIDVLDHVQARGVVKPAAPAVKPQTAPTAGGRLVPHTNIRRSIAEHMAHSMATAPHVTAVFEVDFTAIIADRARRKAAGGPDAAGLTYTAYFVAASVQALQLVPTINGRWHADAIEVFDDINIGVGTALGDEGLVVPVIRKAQALSLMDLSRALNDLTGRARAGKLQRADVTGGTFTISNHGVSGSLLAAPIVINQPQSAILGIGKLEKRAVVREVGGTDSIVIRPMAYVSLTIDHRVIDGHQTNTFLKKWVEVIETWNEAN